MDIEYEQQIFYQNESPDSQAFDQIVSIIQDTVFNQNFDSLHFGFMNKYCNVFEQSEQNKIQYMHLFSLYQKNIQKHLIDQLNKKIPDFDMDSFLKLLEEKVKDNQKVMEEQLQEILMSFVDFQTFKALMLQFKHCRNSIQSNSDKLNSLSLKGQAIIFDNM